MTRVLNDKVIRDAMRTAGEAVVADDAGVGAGAVNDRTTAQGLFVYAEAYLASAEHLLMGNLQIPHKEAPQKHLLFHAAELYLKSFLRLKGLSVSEIKDIGHNFEKLIFKSNGFGLKIPANVGLSLSASDKRGHVISARYIETGFKSEWPLNEMIEGVRSIRTAIMEFPGRQAGIIVWGEGAAASQPTRPI